MSFKINVVDLDKTLIPFDSFRLLLINYLKHQNGITYLSLLVFLRKLRLISSVKFKSIVLRHIRISNSYELLINNLMETILPSINSQILNEVNSETDSNTINVLVSASPVDYVSEIAKNLGWDFIASDFENGEFIHCYGIEKLRLVEKHYPLSDYSYNFAISDALSDIELLKRFKKFRLIEVLN